eukprot:TRINITY_DN1469_c0_g1_i3.p1 TRINITY_DN1469_c0_g1~~TRINITY_DN1469_c0_g1_i3.p1  ORF type:complete len:692 (+),score=153.77 TRINITY_DN1469_c0_g1_i3:261-2336(+)
MESLSSESGEDEDVSVELKQSSLPSTRNNTAVLEGSASQKMHNFDQNAIMASSTSSSSNSNEKRAPRWEVKQPAGVRLTWSSIQYSTASSTSYVPRISFCYPNATNNHPVLLYHKNDSHSLGTATTTNSTVNNFPPSSSSSSSTPPTTIAAPSAPLFYPTVSPATNSMVSSSIASPSISSSPILVCSALSSSLLRALEEGDSISEYKEDDSIDSFEDDSIAYWKKEEPKNGPFCPSSPSSLKGKEKDEDEEEVEEIREVPDLVFQFDEGRFVLSMDNIHKRTNELRNKQEVSRHSRFNKEKEKDDDDDEEDDVYDESCDEEDRQTLAVEESQNPFVMLEKIRQTQRKALEMLEKLLNEDAQPQFLQQVSLELNKLNELEQHYLKLCSNGVSSSLVMKTDICEEDFSCPICWSDISASDGRTLAACDHRYCKDCLAEHFSSKIREAQVLTLKCPHPQCSAAPEVYELEYLLEREIYHKYLEFAVIANLKTDKNAKWCPTLGCGNVIVADPDLTIVKCFSCKKEFCFHCLKWHPGRECTDASFEVTTEEDRQFMLWLDNMKNNVHSCPRCNISIEKNKGCNHMQCTSCSYQFCWLCGKEYSSIHYNEGECAGKQFIETEEIETALVPVEADEVQEQSIVKKPRKGKLSRVASYVALGIAAPPLLVIGMPIVIYKAVKRKNAKKAASKLALYGT